MWHNRGSKGTRRYLWRQRTHSRTQRGEKRPRSTQHLCAAALELPCAEKMVSFMKCKASLVQISQTQVKIIMGSWVMVDRGGRPAEQITTAVGQAETLSRGEEAPRQTDRIFYGTSVYVAFPRTTAHLERDGGRVPVSPQLACPCYDLRVPWSDLDSTSKKSCSPISVATERLRGLFTILLWPASCNQA